MNAFENLVGLGLVSLTLAFVLLGAVVFVARGRHRGGDRAVPVEFFYWASAPLVDRLKQLGVRPNHVTAFSILASVATAFALATGNWFLGIWLLMVTSSCDAIDGFLARSTGQVSPSGAFFDSFVDRWAEGLVFAGLAFLGGGGWLTVGAVLALMGSYAVSYARARGESLGVEAKIGLMQRPQRLVMLVLVLLTGGAVSLFNASMSMTVVTFGIWALALGATATSLRRARQVMLALDGDVSDVDEPAPRPEPLSQARSAA